MIRLLLPGLSGLVVAIATSGCAGPSAIYDRAQSHFDFPNSNITPLGHVRSEVTSTSMGFSDITNPLMEQQAVRDALSQKNGDILIDGVYEWTSRGLPPLISFNKLVVEGEAAKMEDIGRQKRRQ
jgi:hypothetical protein